MRIKRRLVHKYRPVKTRNGKVARSGYSTKEAMAWSSPSSQRWNNCFDLF